jgi:hypothetical protein
VRNPSAAPTLYEMPLTGQYTADKWLLLQTTFTGALDLFVF